MPLPRMVPNPRLQMSAESAMAMQTGLELAQLGKRRNNENHLDYGIRVETMIGKLDTLLKRADEIRAKAGQNHHYFPVL